MSLSRQNPSKSRRRSQRAWLGVSGVLLAVGACACIGLALASQEHAPQPDLSATGSIGRRVHTPQSTTTPNTTGPGGATPTTRGTQPVVPFTLPSSRPVSILIPAIGVRSPIQELGLDQDGTLQVPQPGPHYNEAAWCDCSPTPGQRGPSVILGHVDSASQGPSVFFKLGALRPGDLVIVDRTDGVAATFKVTGVRRYLKDAFPTAVVYGNTPDAQLRLITCGGSFDHGTGHYVDNVVVFATLVEFPRR